MTYAMCFILCLLALTLGAGIASVWHMGLTLKFIGAAAVFGLLLYWVLKL